MRDGVYRSPMKRSCAIALVATWVVGCTSGRPPAAAPSPSVSALSAERLRNLSLSSAFEALSYIPEYLSQQNRRPAARFVLYLDGVRAGDLEALKSIRAADVREIRVVGQSRSVATGGEVEVRVSTVPFGRPR